MYFNSSCSYTVVSTGSSGRHHLQTFLFRVRQWEGKQLHVHVVDVWFSFQAEQAMSRYFTSRTNAWVSFLLTSTFHFTARTNGIGDYVISVGEPFTQCGMIVTSSAEPGSEGDVILSNNIWINKDFGLDLYDSPSGIVSVQCTYKSSMTITAVISPRYVSCNPFKVTK